MLQRIGGFYTFISTILCIAVVVTWVRSGHHADIVLYRTPANHLVAAAADHGALLLASTDLPYEVYVNSAGEEQSPAFVSIAPEAFLQFHDPMFDPLMTKFSFLGIKTAAGIVPGINVSTPPPIASAPVVSSVPRYSAILIPYWLLLALTILPPLFAMRGLWTRHKRKRRGLCMACGYDIRVSAGRCPECGLDIPEKAEAAVVNQA